jgi:hypothetical protein
MFRPAKLVLAAVLAITVGAVPLVLDQCAANCEAHQDSIAGTAACHHNADASSAHLGHAPTSCAHDHTGTLGTSDTGFAPTSRAFVASVAIVPALVIPAPTTRQTRRTRARPGPTPRLDRRSLPLRV